MISVSSFSSVSFPKSSNIVFDQSSSHLHEFLNPLQTDFRYGNTQTILMKLTDNVKLTINRKMVIFLNFLSSSINQELLLRKLFCFHISSLALVWVLPLRQISMRPSPNEFSFWASICQGPSGFNTWPFSICLVDIKDQMHTLNIGTTFYMSIIIYRWHICWWQEFFFIFFFNKSYFLFLLLRLYSLFRIIFYFMNYN